MRRWTDARAAAPARPGLRRHRGRRAVGGAARGRPRGRLRHREGGHGPGRGPRLLTGVLFGRLGAAPGARKRYYELVRAPEFGATAGWADVDPAGFDGLI